jgi:serine/threonine protein kinase
MYSLGVTVYGMLSGGSLPYGDMSQADLRRHHTYISLRKHHAIVPVWMDRAIQKAVSFDPGRRYQTFSEFLYDLSHPNASYVKSPEPLLDKNPIGFWIGISVISLFINLILLFLLTKQ